MLIITPQQYNTFKVGEETNFYVEDHMNGFDRDLKTSVLDKINDHAQENTTVYLEYIVNNQIRANYPNLDLKFNMPLHMVGNFFDTFTSYDDFAPVKFSPREHIWDNFLCSFNGTKSFGRVMLTSALNRAGYFNEKYCSKNFVYSKNDIVSQINSDHSADARLKLLFFDHEQPNTLADKIVDFSYTRFNHLLNYYTLKPLILKSFVHLVSETISNSYYPLVTEKFLYSVICKGLFLAYAPPRWHEHLEQNFGFKKYDKIFDYSFDLIEDPVDRLLALLNMLSRYSKMSSKDWSVLYYIEKDAINYNYNHYYCGKYKSSLMNISEGVTPYHGKTI